MLVCFDLGGVLALIRRTWEECAVAADVVSRLPLEGRTELTDFELFDEFQLGTLDSDGYLRKLGAYLSVSDGEALKIHSAILNRQYDGVDLLVRDLKSAGVRLACLSNTNALHWQILDSPVFPAIQALDLKVVSQEIGLLKPDPKVFGLFDQRAKTSPRDVIYFDDNEGNVSAARLHGWDAHFVDHEGDPASQMREILTGQKILR